MCICNQLRQLCNDLKGKKVASGRAQLIVYFYFSYFHPSLLHIFFFSGLMSKIFSIWMWMKKICSDNAWSIIFQTSVVFFMIFSKGWSFLWKLKTVVSVYFFSERGWTNIFLSLVSKENLKGKHECGFKVNLWMVEWASAKVLLS